MQGIKVRFFGPSRLQLYYDCKYIINKKKSNLTIKATNSSFQI